MADLLDALSCVPISVADPAFHACVFNAARNEEFVANFQRLSGLCHVNDLFARKFISFVHESIYSRLDANVLDFLLRLAEAGCADALAAPELRSASAEQPEGLGRHSACLFAGQEGQFAPISLLSNEGRCTQCISMIGGLARCRRES